MRPHSEATRAGLARILSCAWLGLMLLLLAVSARAAEAPVIQVGVYQNPPKIWRDENGRVAGHFAELVDDFARRFGYRVEYVYCEWEDCLKRLQRGELDLMPDVAVSAERAARFQFNQFPVMRSWSQVYARRPGEIRSLLDLQGKRLAVLRGSLQEREMRDLMASFGLTPSFVAVSSMADVFMLVERGLADVGIVNHLFGRRNQGLYRVHETPVVLFPAQLHFAAPRQGSAALLGQLDRYLLEARGERGSAYNRVLNEVGRPDNASRSTAPDWLTREERDWIAAHPVLRVGVELDYPPFDFVEKGEWRGYSADYLRLLADKAGLRLEIVASPRWSELLAKLRRREIDVLPVLFQTPERERDFLFTPAYKKVAPVVFAREGLGPPLVLDRLDGLAFAIVPGDALIDELRQRLPRARFLEVGDYVEALKRVAHGEADATVMDFAGGTRLARDHTLVNVRSLGEWPRPRGRFDGYHMAVRKDWPQLQAILTKAMARVSDEERARLDVAWFGDVAAPPTPQLTFTAEEREWLARKPVLRMGYDPGFPPFDFTGADGRHAGMVSDYMHLIGERLGIHIEPVHGLSWSEVLDAAREKRIDIVSLARPTPEREKYLLFTRPLIKDLAVIVTRQDEPFSTDLSRYAKRKVAVIRGYATHEVMRQRFPDIEPLLVETNLEGLRAVVSGRAAAMVADLAVSAYEISRHGLSNLKIVAPFELDRPDLAIAVRDDLPILRDLIEKALASITEHERLFIANRWMPGDLARPVDYALILEVVGGFSLLLLLVLAGLWHARRQNALIRQARDAAEAANRAKSVFLANMSHELRTPLNAILGFAQLLRRDAGLVEEQRQWLDGIHRSGQHLLAVINDVLEISRIESGRTVITSASFDLPELVGGIADMMRIRAHEKRLRFELVLPEDMPRHVLGDANRLRQVLLNLLSNAVKYTELGGVTLRVAQTSERIRFEVSDSGPGIPEEEQARLFQPFYQTSLGVARGEGTGLGLAISHELVHLMGGELRLESATGKGSRFSFEIPLPATETPPAPTVSPGTVRALAPGQPVWRVLVAEDQADSRDLLARLLRDVGFDVEVVEDGRKAVEMARGWRPHFICMDIRMPGMDGLEATRRIRELPSGKEIRIVALTASAFENDRGRILAAGCDDVLVKPFDAGRLFAVMERSLGVRFTRDEEHMPQTEQPLAPGALDHIPVELLRGLCKAAELLDIQAARVAIARLRPIDPELADKLASLARDYRLDRIAELCRPVDKQQ